MIIDQEELARITGYKPNQTQRIARALERNGHIVMTGRPGRIYIIVPDTTGLNLPAQSSNDDIRFDD